MCSFFVVVFSPPGLCIIDSSCDRTSNPQTCGMTWFVSLPGPHGRAAESAVWRRDSDVFMSVDEVGAWEDVIR